MIVGPVRLSMGLWWCFHFGSWHVMTWCTFRLKVLISFTLIHHLVCFDSIVPRRMILQIFSNWGLDVFILLLTVVSWSVLVIYNILYLFSFPFSALCQLSFGFHDHSFDIFLVIFRTLSCTISSSLSQPLSASSYTFRLPFNIGRTFRYL